MTCDVTVYKIITITTTIKFLDIQCFWDSGIHQLRKRYYLIIPPSPVYTHLLTSIFLDNPKSASLTWVQDSTRSTLSPTESKQTDVEWEGSYKSASLRATRTRTTLICKFHCAKQQNWMLRSRAFHFCKFRCCFRPLDLYGQRMCLKIFVFNFRSPDLQTNFKSTYFWRVWI